MAMKTLVKNCPFCKKVVEQRAYASWGRQPSEQDKWLFGTPLRLCPHCGKLFIDKDIQELAITGPRRQDTAIVGQASLRLALMGVVLGALLLIGRLNVLAYIAFGVALVTVGADAALYPTRQKKLEAERLASEKRLSDPGYARALKNAGYDIPERYLTKEEAT
ncbi:MAG: hypothetical protein IKF98_06615 [Clostridia bacterium]|nr:hypothetical protein [Clostridia bacterium]MBR3273573.1 hypothetical protein [Clostridia bacterium]